MQASSIPAKFQIPFASSAGAGYINTIPVASQQSSANPGAASYTDGFPPDTFVPVAAGGIPPSGADFNGILGPITSWIQWMTAGGSVPYDSTFQGQIGGYPNGARVVSATTAGKVWLSTADNNTSNPDAGGANWASAAIAGIGFTPVQQGGGANQGSNKVYLGWSSDSAGPRIQVDVSDRGIVAMVNTFASGYVTTGTNWVEGDYGAWTTIPTPIGNIIIQFGVISVPQTGTGPYTFGLPTPFQQVFYAITGSFGAATTPPISNTPSTLGFSPSGLANFRVQSTINTGGSPDATNFFAIGI